MPTLNICPHQDPTDVNEAAASATPGDLYFYRHPTYGPWVLRYGQFKDAVTYAAGQGLTLASIYKIAFTNDVSGGSSVGGLAGGVALKAMTQNYYGYALVRGHYPTVLTNGDDDIAIGNNLFVGGADGTVNSSTTADGANLGYAVAADSDPNNTVAAWVDCI